MVFGVETEKLTRGHQRIADYLSKNMDDVPFMIEEDIAAAWGMSVSTVSRKLHLLGVRSCIG